jgi:diaminohydroxyphosphoribosylaminopyrimidine deaminase/5-amino-6-(5-phosphoribosylamino)uracil reductase
LLDHNARLSPDSRLAQTARDAPVLLFSAGGAPSSSISALESHGVEVIRGANDGRDLLAVLKELVSRSIQSVLVEGGATVAGAFLDARLVEKVSFFIAPIIIGGERAPQAIGGTGAERIADAIGLHDVEITQHGRDVEVTGYTREGMRDEEKTKSV